MTKAHLVATPQMLLCCQAHLPNGRIAAGLQVMLVDRVSVSMPTMPPSFLPTSDPPLFPSSSPTLSTLSLTLTHSHTHTLTYSHANTYTRIKVFKCWITLASSLRDDISLDDFHGVFVNAVPGADCDVDLGCRLSRPWSTSEEGDPTIPNTELVAALSRTGYSCVVLTFQREGMLFILKAIADRSAAERYCSHQDDIKLFDLQTWQGLLDLTDAAGRVGKRVWDTASPRRYDVVSGTLEARRAQKRRPCSSDGTKSISNWDGTGVNSTWLTCSWKSGRLNEVES
ncbi:unnamed protein product [Protopolystoma xenopodis]|uniref:Uncharacterized protein n=1 Tax=Protopolystoma xenopodis TaxID=117903 RepID=A0A448XNG4_9PLAT|nr:unnamed protein product [Protopolystoma xenopodis]